MGKRAVIYSVFSFLAGAGAGFFVSMKHFEAKYNKIANEEIASVKEVYETKLDKMMKYYPTAKTVDPEANASRKRTEDSDGRTRDTIKMNSYEKAKMNYNLVRPGEDREDEIEEDMDDDEENFDLDEAGMSDEEHKRAAEVVKGDPYIIESDEYAEDTLGYDKASLYYYRMDDVVCGDDGEDVITEIEEVIGYDALCALDTQSMVWVRNERLHIDYEIIAVNSAYADEVGRATSPRERYNKLKRRDDNES